MPLNARSVLFLSEVHHLSLTVLHVVFNELEEIETDLLQAYYEVGKWQRKRKFLNKFIN